MKSKQDWKTFGDEDPFYGVLSEERYKYKNFNKNGRAEFYKTGYQYVEELKSRIESKFGHGILDMDVLDFGCGVGRLTLPFAQQTTGKVIGLDVSPGMIKIADEQRDIHKFKNLTYHAYSGIDIPNFGTFDLVNSYIVIQHIEPSIGYPLIDQLCKMAKIGGIVHLQMPYGHNIPILKYLKFYLKVHSDFYNRFTNMVKTGSFTRTPVMQMNYYSSDSLESIFKKYTDIVHKEPTDHGGHLGNFYYFKRIK
ncbi:class I SAM-dependent methyltransferase [Anditalea andensis]|uniref:Methyltransferase domain-containing protein n=1 Tax=Anditalea andensis TaxID=1048983 RepID=A0A074L1C9_9BACT|nr:class I SAM-dependent methyltransferase [Anditalea andensis]KEO73628.1 hypothetical protein EL17_12065 [Anditalea andensis]